MKPTPSLRSFLLASSLLAAVTANAQTWTGGGADANWTTAGNWTGDTPDTSDSGTSTVTFYNTGATQFTNSTGGRYNLNQIAFNSGATSPVTINVTASPNTFDSGTAIRFNAGTNISVAAGDHKIVGTGVNGGASFDVIFNGAAGSTHTFDIATGASFDINARISRGSVSDNKSYAKTGGGTLILSGFNGGTNAWAINATKAFQIQQGAVRFAQSNATGNSQNNYVVSSGAAFEIDGVSLQINNGNVTLNGTGISSGGALRSISGNSILQGNNTTGTIVLASSSSIGVDAGSTLTLKKQISESGGARNLTKVGDGTLVFDSTLQGAGGAFANAYTGSTIIRAGTLEIKGTNVGTGYEIANSADNAGGNDPVLKLGNVSAIPTTANITGANSAARTGFLDLAVAGDYTMGSFVKGNLKFVNSSGSNSTLKFTENSAITVASDGGRTFTNQSADLSIVFEGTLDIGSSTDNSVRIDTVGTITVEGGIISTGAGIRNFEKRLEGTLVLGGTSTISGTTTVTAGTLEVRGSIASSSGITNNAALVFNSAADQSYGNGIGGSGTLTKQGAGTLTLSANNSYTGATTISQGILQIGNGGTTGTLGDHSNTAIASGAELRIDRIGTSPTFGYSYFGELSGSGTVNILESRRFNFQNNNQTSSGSLSFIVDGVLGINTGSNVTAVHLGELSGSGVIQRAGNAPTNPPLTTLTIGGKNTSSTYSGNITNIAEFAIEKVGSGTLTLSGVNGYGGPTTISAGTLALGAGGSINNTSGVHLGGGTFDVSAKSGYAVAKLSGNGSVVGALSVSTELAIGTSAGTINFEDLTLGGASSFIHEITGGSSAADLGIVSGSMTIDSGAILDLVQLGIYTLDDRFTLFAYQEGNLTGTFSGLSQGGTFTAAGGLWQIDYFDTTAGLNADAGDGTRFVNITAIPEPRAALLGGLGLLALLRRRRS